jgi:hypothetical protein
MATRLTVVGPGRASHAVSARSANGTAGFPAVPRASVCSLRDRHAFCDAARLISGGRRGAGDGERFKSPASRISRQSGVCTARTTAQLCPQLLHQAINRQFGRAGWHAVNFPARQCGLMNTKPLGKFCLGFSRQFSGCFQLLTAHGSNNMHKLEIMQYGLGS